MKKIIGVSFCSIVLCASALSGWAGDVKGKVEANKKTLSQAVVWVEGVTKFTVPSAHLNISQKNVEFSPPLSVVVAGQTVDMPNDDAITHNVFSFSPAKKFNLGIYGQGQSKSVVFDKPGLVDMYCSIHRNMNAKILVVPNPYFAITNESGEYRIPDVPAGQYTLKVWHADRPETSRKITVTASGTTSQDLSFAEDKGH